MGDKARLEAIVSGFVQGVGFRYFVLREAERLDIVGYVCNLPDGRRVEVVAEGPREQLEDLLFVLKKGPIGAHIEKVDALWTGPTNQFTHFEVRF